MSTRPVSNSMRIYLPRLPTAATRRFRSLRSNADRDVPEAILLRLSSVARIRRPTITGRSARTTCSTSGSSGIRGKTFLISDLRLPIGLLLVSQFQSEAHESTLKIGNRQSAIGNRKSLDSAKQQQNQDDDQDQPESPAGRITPVAAIRPSWD